MSRVGIFGGTFDPVHHGHLITAQFIKEKRNLEKIIFVPAFTSPFKQELIVSDSEHRIQMLKLAIEGIPYFDWSDFEIKKRGISYSIDTLLEMKKKFDEIELIIGEDNLQSFDKWKLPGEIVKLARLIVLRRRIDEETKTNNDFKANTVPLETPLIDISGTRIRERVKNGLPINFLVPQKVMEYIYSVNLYKV
jgi:nicotinate-nucleotide adenylyltransferase